MEFPFDNAWILSELSEYCADFNRAQKEAELEKISLKAVGENGFLANVYLITASFANGQLLEVVVKLCGRVLEDFEEVTVTDGFLETLHNRECLFYARFGARTPLPIPVVYHSGPPVPGKRPGFLLMECLSGKGTSFHFSQGLSVPQLLELARFVGSMQAHSLLMEDKSWLAEFEKPNYDMLAQDEFILRTLLRLKGLRDGVFEEEAEVLSEHVKNDFMTFSQYKLHKTLDISPVLVHGDLWTHNVMWKMENGFPSDKLERVYDFQGAHAGNPAWDLTRLLVLCTDGDVRIRYWEDVFAEYYRTLEDILKERKVEVPFTLKRVKRCYEYIFVNQTIQFCNSLVYQEMNLQVAEVEEFPYLEARFEKVLVRAKIAVREAMQKLKTLEYSDSL
ncbi:hypothetical protein QR680_013868 [Steinernema hermaphroditum]|uniref:CHK kinase-like domain-containing protein n=1 Tax=Steinernema hermaphroditum TaxID=289476 RepID=A0AA39M295_9BILA|nr:hypothetical protein QR680_013868 [Steinernema hermaphroditum]